MRQMTELAGGVCTVKPQLGLGLGVSLKLKENVYLDLTIS